MCEDTLPLDLVKCLQTLPTSGMTQDGKLYELAMLVRPIKEQDYSLLPTPKVGGQGTNPAEYQRVTPGLAAIVNLLPTPTAMHVRNHDEPLQAYEQRVMDYKQGKTKGKPGASTGVAVRLIATPTTNISHTTGKCRNWGADLLHDVKCQCKIYRLHWSMQN